MGLATYRRKRDFAESPEPRGRVHRARKTLRFIVQKHQARQLHYDFRLEWDGVLKSWAVPRGPSLDPAVRALAIEVEDHPLEYGDFEGTIPAGQYGAGSVQRWDEGQWIPQEDAAAGFRNGRLTFLLEGKKLRGRWRLVRIRPRGGSDERRQWLLIKSRDAHARRRISSTKTPRRKSSHEARNTPAQIPLPAGELHHARKSRQPAWVAPQLATLVNEPPRAGPWLYEIKYDGYRLIAVRRGRSVRLLTRNRKDWTARFRAVARAVAALPARECILDGEVIVLDRQGVSDFQALQQQLQNGARGQLLYMAFDVTHCNGYDLRAAPLIERKELLAAMLAQAPKSGVVRYSDHIGGDGADALQLACKQGLEGLIAKRGDAPYESRRSRTWLKLKCGARQEFVIAGFTEPRGARSGFGALLLGDHDRDGRLQYCGRVGTGFDERTLTRMRTQLGRLEQKSSPFANAPTGASARGVHWVRPELVAEVGYRTVTADGMLRQPVFKGLRLDKKASEVVRESPAANAESSRPSARRAAPRAGRDHSPATSRVPQRGRQTSARTTKRAGPIVAGVKLTHPERVLYPESSITKAQLAAYYEAVGEAMLREAADRPLMLVRCPEGRTGDCFHQKHMTHTFPDAVRSAAIREKSKTIRYPVVDDVAGLVALVQMNTLEVHGWLSRVGDVDHPDRLIFDLDPGEGVRWRALIEAALEVRERLADCGLTSYVKTSGGKGLHVVAPLRPAASWQACRAFAEAISRQVRDAAPERFASKMTKSLRRGRIYIDCLRNARGATCVLAYSTRARPGAPVSLPLSWPALKRTDDPAEFTVETVPARLRRTKDPWPGFARSRQTLSRRALEKVGAAPDEG